MQVMHPRRSFRATLTLVAILCAAQCIMAATPGITLTATNVSIPGQGNATSKFTVQSVNGYSGQVNVGCSGPDNNLLPDLVLPVCDQPVSVTVPASGSATGTIEFTPPWAANSAQRTPAGSHSAASPLLACVIAGFGIFSLRSRLNFGKKLSLVLFAACSIMSIGLSGCIGQGGLAMTPGTYAYTLGAASSTVSASVDIKVTVQCNSCP